MEYRWERHDEAISEVTVEWTRDILYGIGQYPTDPEHSPKRFRCYTCLRMRGQRKFGGLVAGKHICCYCLPYVDERFIGWLINRERGKSRGRARRRLKRVPA